MTDDPSRPDPAAALLAALRAAHAEAEAKDPSAAAWLGDVVAVVKKAIPAIQAEARDQMQRETHRLLVRAWDEANSRGFALYHAVRALDDARHILRSPDERAWFARRVEEASHG